VAQHQAGIFFEISFEREERDKYEDTHTGQNREEGFGRIGK
jgi:hypothetical protein